jgi:hypothetical protein
MSNDLQIFIDKFLDIYNPSKTIERAISESLRAASQHNGLYLKSLDTKKTAEIKAYWGDQLDKISSRYKSQRLLIEYEKDIIELKTLMNEKYLDYFRKAEKGGDGFRISHSQKSISVYLKHLWCLRKISMPPCCPVDRKILELTECKDKSWTFVNDIETHRKKFAYIETEAKKENFSIAEWEIRHFEA